MAAKIQALLDEYGESHQNMTNKLIHWVCVPLIMFSLLGLLHAIPFPEITGGWYESWAVAVFIFTLGYYFRLSVVMFMGFIIVGGAMVAGNYLIMHWLGGSAVYLAIFSTVVFVLAWIGQFIGHKIEGKKPSFFKDLQFLLIGPAWLMHFVFRKLGVSY